MSEKVKIVALLGSLRQGSFNRMVLNAALELCPSQAEIEPLDFSDFPIFNADFEPNMPSKILDFKSKIKNADAILIVTPEYNYSIPGGLKNALDWASRPYGDNSFDGKAVAIMSASPGNMGASRAQYHLRQCFVFLNMYPLNTPEVIVSNVQDKVDASGKITDQHTRDKIVEQLNALITWSQNLRKVL